MAGVGPHSRFDARRSRLALPDMDLAGVGELVRERRRASGLSQKDLARLAGISRATLNYLENEPDSDMGAVKLLALLDVLGVRLSFAPDGPEQDEATVDEALRSIPKASRIARAVLVEALVTGRPPVGQEPALAAFMEKASLAAVLAAARLAGADPSTNPKAVWKHVGTLADACTVQRKELQRA